MSPVRIWEAGLTVPKCPGSVVAYHDCLSRNRLGFEFRPGRHPFLFVQSLDQEIYPSHEKSTRYGDLCPKLVDVIALFFQKSLNPEFRVRIRIPETQYGLFPGGPQAGILRMERQSTPYRSDKNSRCIPNPHDYAAVKLALRRAVVMNGAE